MEENRLFTDYGQNIAYMSQKLRVEKSFDIIERHLTVCNRDMCFFYIDGFVKDGEMLRIMQYLLSQKEIGSADQLEKKLPYVEVELTSEPRKIIRAVLSGASEKMLVIVGPCSAHAHAPVIEYIKRLRSLGHKTPTAKMIKTEKQIEGCRLAGKINSLILDAVEREIEVGMTTAHIDDIVMRETKALGAIPACLGFEGFPRAVCTSKNNVVCHGIPSEKDVIREGDIINVDCTTIYEGFFGDASRMYTFGKISPVAEKLVSTTREAVELAVKAIAPYRSHLGDIGYVINRHAKANGFSVVREIGGHGVGLEMHEDPYVCHIGLLGSGMLLLPGMIFTVEPMINQGTSKFYVDPKDGWTVCTMDGLLSAQVEYEILVTESGTEILSR